MNEKFKEIAVKAQLEHCVSHVRLQELCELLVKECAEVAACNGHVSGFSLGDLIKEHFGVK